jgi:Ubiquitin family
MFEDAGEFLQIHVETPGGTTITMKLCSSNIILQVKGVIQARLYHPTKVQRLTYEGKQLEDSMTLGHYNIQNDSTLHLEVETKKEKKPFVWVEGEKDAKEATEKDVPFFQGAEEEEEEEEDFEAGPIADLFRREKEEEEETKEEAAASSSTAPLYLFPCW